MLWTRLNTVEAFTENPPNARCLTVNRQSYLANVFKRSVVMLMHVY